MVIGRCGLGHTRLAVIDIPGGGQPMSSPDGAVTIVYNGEIYNFRELRSELESGGRVFTTGSDTEVLLALYEAEGADCVRRLRGMFAFAVWERDAERLVLARDRVGVKPLYYAICDGRLHFASEMKSIVQDRRVDRSLDATALRDYLHFSWVPGERTGLAGISSLLPGHVLTWEGGRADVRRYWRLDVSADDDISFDEAVEGADAALREAVRCRLVSDRPVGVFLSGGIDSSLVAAAVSDVSDDALPCFAMGFGEGAFDERPHAREAAAKLGAELNEFSIAPDAADILPRMAWHLDEPFGDSSALATWYLARETANEVTVVLSGDGGDESYAGYERYIGARITGWLGLVPRMLREGLGAPLLSALGAGRSRRGLVSDLARLNEASLAPDGGDYASLLAVASGELVASLLTSDFADAAGPGSPLEHVRAAAEGAGTSDPIDRASAADVACYLPDDILVKVDRMSMAFGLEVRSPFLDTPLMEAAARVPSRLKVSGTTPKRILRHLARRRFGAGIADRRKAGFAVPVCEWFRGPLAGLARDRLVGGGLAAGGILSREALSGLLESHSTGAVDAGQLIWSLLAAEFWHEAFVAGDGAAPG